MALTKVKNSNLDDADLVALAGNDGSALTGISVAPSSITGVTSTAAELNILDGVTSTAAELNILDGVTSTAAELNILDGVTSTAAELNHVDGVTSAIQAQLDAKQASDADLTTLATNGIGTSANQLVQLDGSAKLPAVDGSNLTGVDSLPTQTSQSGKFLTTNGSAASWGTPGGGKVLQVTSSVYTGYTSVSSNSFTAIPMNDWMTPSSSSSKILVMVAGGGLEPVSAAGGVVVQVWRTLNNGGTWSALPSAGMAFNAYSEGACAVSITYLDTTVSQTTQVGYQLRVKEDNSNTVYINYYGEADMTMTLMEIGA